MALRTSAAARLGVSPADLGVVELVARRGPLTAGELAAATGLASASVTALIDRLASARFVRRVRDPEDGRRVRVASRPDGMRRVGEAFFASGLDLQGLGAAYSTPELDRVSDVLERLAMHLRAAERGEPVR